MKKYTIFILLFTILVILFLIWYIVASKNNPIISKIIKNDKNIIIYKIINISPFKYYYGMDEELQYKEDDNWVYVEVKNNVIVQSIAIGISGFGTGKNKFEKNLKEKYGELKNGKYRIVKRFFREERNKKTIEYKLYIYFDI